MTKEEKKQRHRELSREWARKKRVKEGKVKRVRFWVADKTKKCGDCHKLFKLESNNQKFCKICRPQKFVSLFIRPPKDPIDKLLDDMDFKRSKMNPYL